MSPGTVSRRCGSGAAHVLRSSSSSEDLPIGYWTSVEAACPLAFELHIAFYNKALMGKGSDLTPHGLVVTSHVK